MANFRERIKTAAQRWKDSAKSDTELFSKDYDRMLVFLWCHSRGGKTEGYSDDIAEFAQANKAAIGDDNYNKMLRTREYCDGCGERYKLENLSICVECCNLYCYRCVGQRGISSNGNYRCSCSGDLVG
ncbi:hypothetical protein [Anabaena sp. UHCC 0399]|jgi:hypothetical protein|uniref:hypothetical protein n=1 Tax=Anabaena sp. UHCC 0399 TaxID=3110238 RepID=UPI002B1FF936|nr:hypothetical protein [Anabaena sp. UHCC 0399]MEA5567630.1 hypothetical protein [Anabaena sp. UHCC 0399]